MDDAGDDAGLEHGLLEEGQEISALIQTVTQSAGKSARHVYDRYKHIVSARPLYATYT